MKSKITLIFGLEGQQLALCVKGSHGVINVEHNYSEVPFDAYDLAIEDAKKLKDVLDKQIKEYELSIECKTNNVGYISDYRHGYADISKAIEALKLNFDPESPKF